MKKNNDLISVIVSVYNAEQYLEKCVYSIFNQTYKNIELILVNDGSTDNSGALCDGFKTMDSRVKVIHKENGGVSTAKNAGLENAKGEYIIFVDSDDWIEENMLETLYKGCVDNGAKIACGGRYDVYGDEKRIGLCPREKSLISSEEMILKLFEIKECDPSFADKLVNRSLFGELRFPVGQIHEEEAIIYDIVHRASTIYLIDIPLYNYYHRSLSLSSAPFSDRFLVIFERFEKLKSFIDEKYPNLESEAKKYIIKKTFSTLVSIYLSDKKTRKKYEQLYKKLLEDVSKNKRYLSKRDSKKYILIKMHLYRILRKIVKNSHKKGKTCKK